MNSLEDFIDLMTEYTDFFEAMADDEGERYLALSSMDYAGIKKAVARQQANAKRLEQLEQLREELQRGLGLGDKTFYEIARATPGEDGEYLTDLYYELSEAVRVVKYYNGKSMKVARECMEEIQEHIPSGAQTPQGYTPVSIRSGEGVSSSTATLFETKV